MKVYHFSINNIFQIKIRKDPTIVAEHVSMKRRCHQMVNLPNYGLTYRVLMSTAVCIAGTFCTISIVLLFLV